MATVNRHLPVMRTCVGTSDTALLVARCAPSRQPIGRTTPTTLLLLTRHRLVITGESRVFRRLHLYLNESLAHLANVTWSPALDRRAVQLAVTAMDGVREHFWIAMSCADEVMRADALLRAFFRPRVLTPA